MRSDVSILYDARRAIHLVTQVEPGPEGAARAREWFDEKWDAFGCEPLRPSGKVLLLDKILGVADALGYDLLAADTARAQEFAHHAALALGTPRITIDLQGLTVGY
ncbi:hypothetical protein [Bordetella genomosp. 9]|uniref:Uncharacterized protein n=1 Tax=Bordetella genomosp. 9 TaxID=1416803 RepID=A0A1W6YUQ8_9BORD|nr:hypothetical protein [Bordetella genomosp. 9]ARP84832.1 hypothetical protein CAL13_00255 [Bordetella genomosp. 9]ARP88922.1 hypothetical protein CAL14_00255 [Bordetella genomosp. 9]